MSRQGLPPFPLPPPPKPIEDKQKRGIMEMMEYLDWHDALCAMKYLCRNYETYYVSVRINSVTLEIAIMITRQWRVTMYHLSTVERYLPVSVTTIKCHFYVFSTYKIISFH